MTPRTFWNRALAWSLGCAVLRVLGSSDATFEEKIRPVLAENCFRCHSHSAEKLKGGLVLDSASGLRHGGESGEALVVPGEPAQSALLRRIKSNDPQERMPPKGPRLSAEEQKLLTEWVAQGAPGLDAEKLKARPRGQITEDDRTWWAFQPVRNVPVPRVRDSGWGRTDVDRFILDRLTTASLTPSPEASRTVLIRRLYFDLWGLPPSAAEIDEFIADRRSDAYERLVDRLLASPHYGERWARHWLDLVRYADSDGYKSDDLRPTAWRYRDYVIRSLNADKPYDRFVQEQLAGDELYPDEPDAQIGTGYLRLGIYEYNNRDAAGQWNTVLTDITDTTGDVFLGLGFQCARCHDHKFDPLLQKDYFRLQAFFAGIQWHDQLPVATAAERAEYQRQLAVWEEKTASLRAQIDALEAPYRTKLAESAISKFPPEIQTILRKPEADRSPWERQVGSLAYRQITYEHDRLSSGLKPEDKEALAKLRKELAAFDGDRPAPLPVTLTVRDVGPVAPPTRIPKRTGEPIQPGLPTVLQESPALIPARPQAPESTGRRAALAEWLTQPDHPLTARVMVNRVWQYHFGRGLVGTSSDFGHLGDAPTHPELLDWLTRRFVAEGWSLKKLHRLLVTSAVYRQASSPGTVAETSSRSRARRERTLVQQWERNQTLDPENRNWWRGQTRRLDAEQIRDALLTATRELKPEPVGPAADPSQFRRSIYTKVLRNTRDPLLEVFDVPQQFSSTPSRDTTTTPVQSLLLINSPQLLQRSRAMAQALQTESGGQMPKAVELAYLSTFGRRPAPAEAKAAAEFLAAQLCVVDPELALSASAGFQSDRIPFRDGRAALMAPRSPQEVLTAQWPGATLDGDFTVESFVYLRTLPEDASLRAIVALRGGTDVEAGWMLGVSGRKSPHPQTLALQLSGRSGSGAAVSDEVSSDLVLQMDKPYFVAASVRFQGESGPQVTFYVKDLSNDEEPLLITRSRTSVVRASPRQPTLTLAGRPGGKNLWDGLIDDVRISSGALGPADLELNRPGALDSTVGLWEFEAKPSYFRDASGQGRDLRPTKPSDAPTLDARILALADLCQVLLNANEFLYVE